MASLRFLGIYLLYLLLFARGRFYVGEAARFLLVGPTILAISFICRRLV